MGKTGTVKNNGHISWTDKAVSKLGGLPRLDGWVNVLTGLGDPNRDKRLSSTFQRTSRLSQQREYLNETFSGDDLVANVVEIPAEEAVREWFEVVIQGDEDDGGADNETASSIMGQLDELNAQEVTADALVWSRLFGGSVILLGVDDGQEVDQPLNFDTIKSLDWIAALDRFDIEIDSFYEDPLEENYGLPEFYRVTGSTVVPRSGAPDAARASLNPIIHESRLIRFDGTRTTRRRRRENRGWADSVLERTLDVIRDYQASQGGIAHLLTTFSQAVLKIKDLAKALAADKDALVLKRLTMLDMARSIVKAIPIDAEHEDYTTTGQAVGGMADLVDRQMMRVSSAVRIPVTLLFGRSPAGMNATGESDIRLFYDRIASFQETQLRRRLEYLLTVMLNAKDGPTGGAEPESWSFDFVPLYQESSKEQAETRLAVAKTDDIYLKNGVVSADEIALSRYGGDDYSNDTQLDKGQRAEDKIEKERIAAEMEARGILPGMQPQAKPGQPEDDDEVDDDGNPVTDGYQLATEEQRTDGETCRGCMFAVGRDCRRHDRMTDLGFRCDSWLQKSEALVRLDGKQRNMRKGKGRMNGKGRRHGRNS